MAQFHQLTVKDIRKETDACVSISFHVPQALQSDFLFKAGQYITLKTVINGESFRRDYSICSSPKSGELRVAVKEVANGTFSKFANHSLKIGDILEVSTPNGRFIFEPNESQTRTIAAFAAGSGITPVLSIAKSILEQEPNSRFVLIYGNKTPKDTIFFNELLALHSQYSERFSLQFVFSQTQEIDALFGRIERSTVNFILKNNYKDLVIDAFYICGPEEMIHTVSEVLKENGVEESKIKYELFTVAAPTETINNVLADGKTQVTMMLDDEETTFVMDQKKSILEAALAEKLDAPYSCQGGICSSCIARLTEGEVMMRQNNILTDREVEDGFILTCQAHPLTPTIKVDYDDI